MLFVVDPDGSNKVQISQAPMYAYGGQFSPDGARLLYVGQGDNDDIFAADVDGASEAMLTDDPANEAAPAWSPDGTRIAYTHATLQARHLYVMAADGNDKTELTADFEHFDGPVWSPDGSRIASCATIDGQIGTAIMNADGTSRAIHPGACRSVRWTPDGSRASICGADGIVTVDTAASDPQLLTDVECSAHGYSPGGSLIAFEGLTEREVFVLDADGGTATPLLPDDDMYSFGIAWRPI
jgi:dipeptidyl aminopeptidase/acylaminoacyl peptidase